MYANTSQKTKSAKSIYNKHLVDQWVILTNFFKNATDDQLFNKINTYFTIKCQVKRLVVKNCIAFAKQIIV